jgi:ADP-ribose pyrophosphatase YjhB (NUDIX family)
MTSIIYCLNCGSGLAESLLPTESRPRLVCASCGYIHYLNPKVVCGTLPVEGDKVWLLRRGIEPRLGYWTYPAGFLEIDETTEEAARRETLEEIGCDVEITGLFGVYSRPEAPVNIVYLARLADDGLPCTTGEALEVRAFARADIPWTALAFPSTYLVLQDWVGQNQ